MKTNTTVIRLGGLARMSLAAAIAIGSGGAIAYAEPPSLPDSTSPITPLDASTGFHPIPLSNTQLCVQPLGGSTGDVIVELHQCNSTSAQNWLFARQASGDFEIINQQSGRCLYVNGGATENVEITHSDCNVFGTSIPSSNALWKPSSLLGFATVMSRIGHRDSGLCIDSFGNAFDGIGLRTFRCNGHPPQVFVVGQ